LRHDISLYDLFRDFFLVRIERHAIVVAVQTSLKKPHASGVIQLGLLADDVAVETLEHTGWELCPLIAGEDRVV